MHKAEKNAKAYLSSYSREYRCEAKRVLLAIDDACNDEGMAYTQDLFTHIDAILVYFFAGGKGLYDV